MKVTYLFGNGRNLKLRCLTLVRSWRLQVVCFQANGTFAVTRGNLTSAGKDFNLNTVVPTISGATPLYVPTVGGPMVIQGNYFNTNGTIVVFQVNAVILHFNCLTSGLNSRLVGVAVCLRKCLSLLR